jgi:hypothetical protein
LLTRVTPSAGVPPTNTRIINVIFENLGTAEAVNEKVASGVVGKVVEASLI